jgi:hypothetical protein
MPPRLHTACGLVSLKSQVDTKKSKATGKVITEVDEQE